MLRTPRNLLPLTFVVWEVVLHWAHWELLLEAVDLVKEQDDGRLDEPPRIANGVEQCEGFLHAVDRLVLEEELIVLGDGDEEEDCGDVLEAMDPLLPLRALSTDVEHAICQVANDEGRLGDTRGLDTRPEDILVVGDVVWGGDAIDGVEVAETRLIPET